MKKLLGLLAVAPMALAACGGDEAAKADHVSYFAGHGINTGDNGDNGAQNTWGAVIEASVFDNDGALTYNIEESNGGVMDFAAVMTADVADIATNWVAATDDSTTGDIDESLVGVLGSAITAAGTENGATIDAATYYNNTGESLRYLYEIIELADFDRADSLVDGKDSDTKADFVNKDESYGNNDSFYWMSNKKAWENFLGRVYPSCTEVNAATDAQIDAFAAGKGNADDLKIAGATATESGLYIAAGIKTAQAHCAE